MEMALKTDSVWDICEKASRIQNVSGMEILLGDEIELLGYEKYAFFSFVPGDETTWMSSDALPLKGYIDQRAYTRDPILHRAEGSVTPISWNTHRWDRPLGESEQTVLSLLRDLDIDCGVSVPIHGPRLRFSVLCLSRHDKLRSFTPVSGELEGALHLLGAYVASYFQSDAAASSKASLTPREIECLSWTAEGKTAWEIGEILVISERTVRYHLGNAMQKLNVSSKFQAVLKALTTGLMHF